MPSMPTPPTFTVQLFLDSLFFGLLTFFNGEMSESRNSCNVKVGDVDVEGTMTSAKIGALVCD